jgi:hypothetical protein
MRQGEVVSKEMIVDLCRSAGSTMLVRGLSEGGNSRGKKLQVKDIQLGGRSVYMEAGALQDCHTCLTFRLGLTR